MMDTASAFRKATGLAPEEPATPAPDYGYFGPGSVTWKVWSYPTSMVLGFSRAVTIEHLDPFLAAAVDATGQVEDRPRTRYDRTMQYFALVAFGDAESVLKAQDILMKVHSKAIGTEPITGKPFDANDPQSQLWIHLTAWHSILYTYEMFGPGKLTDAEERQYWEECARAAEFQTIDTADVPRTREGIREYFENYRPQLVSSEAAQRLMAFLVTIGYEILPDTVPNWIRKAFNVPMRAGIIATMPGWMRKLAGLNQSWAVDIAARAVVRPFIRYLARRPHLELAALDLTTPLTTPILAPALLGIPADKPVIYTPSQARQKFGYTRTPIEQYHEMVAQREAGQGPTPYRRHHHDRPLEFTETAS